MRRNLAIALAALSCLVSASLVSAALPPGYTAKPFAGDTLLGKPQQIPGVVKAMFWDNGGEGVSQHMSGGIQGYSGNDYDVIGYGTSGNFDSSVNATHPTSHLAYIGCDNPTATPPIVGTWFKYTVHVNTAGTYYVDFKQATAIAPPNLQAITYYDGTSVTLDSVANLPMCITPPGCPEVWHAWTVNMNVDSVALDTGLQVVQINFHVGSWNFDWMRFRLKGGTGTQVPALLRSQAGPIGLRATLSGARLTLSYNAMAAASTRISITNCAGKTVVSSLDEKDAVGSRTASLNVRNLRPGVYFVNVERGNSWETKSITIAH